MGTGFSEITVYVCCILWTIVDCLTSSDFPHFTPVSINVFSHEGFQPSSSRCPRTFSASFMLGATQVQLSLVHNPHTLNVPVFIGVNNTVKPWHNKNKQESCFYHDLENGASISLSRKTVNYKLDGAFRINGKTYGIRPMSTLQRVRRATTRLKQEGHMIYTYSKHPSASVLNSIKSNVKSRKRRGIITTYQVEVYFLIDYSIYLRWKDKSTATSESEQHAEAIEDTRYYYTWVANEMDLRYRTISQNDGSTFNYKIILSGMYIATTTSDAPWTESSDRKMWPRGYDRPLVDVEDTLSYLKSWVMQRTTYQAYDHVMLFTGYDLYHVEGGVARTSTTGLAYRGRICQNEKVSICEDKGLLQVSTVAAHELGHSLGAEHDGTGNDCSSADQYVMTDLLVTRMPDNYDNIFYFSSCSVDKFKETLVDLKLAGRNCLTNQGSVYNQTEAMAYLAQKPGQRWSLDEMCETIYGIGSLFCGAQEDRFNICKSIVCSDPDRNHNCFVYNDVAAFEGTTCGDNMWCYRGDCVRDAKAPDADADCVFGDYQGLLGGTTRCEAYIDNSPWACYNPENRMLCCHSCGIIYDDSIQGCEYGDKASWCATDMTPYDCYSEHNRGICCEYCEQHKTWIEGCEYGDHSTSCSQSSCRTSHGRSVCCETCAPKTTPGPTTTTTTTTTKSSTPTTGTTSTTTESQPDSTATKQTFIQPQSTTEVVFSSSRIVLPSAISLLTLVLLSISLQGS